MADEAESATAKAQLLMGFGGAGVGGGGGMTGQANGGIPYDDEVEDF